MARRVSGGSVGLLRAGVTQSFYTGLYATLLIGELRLLSVPGCPLQYLGGKLQAVAEAGIGWGIAGETRSGLRDSPDSVSYLGDDRSARWTAGGHHSIVDVDRRLLGEWVAPIKSGDDGDP